MKRTPSTRAALRELAAHVRNESGKYAKLIKKADIKGQ